MSNGSGNRVVLKKPRPSLDLKLLLTSHPGFHHCHNLPPDDDDDVEALGQALEIAVAVFEYRPSRAH